MMKLLQIIFLSTLFSCAQMEQDFVNHTCNYDAAYEAGHNDSRELKKLNTSQYQNCPEEKRKDAINGYKEGYAKGKPLIEKSGASIQIGGTTINIPGKKNNKAYFCELSAFTDNFEAFGPTQLEATMNVVKLCRAKHNEMHCDKDEVECRVN